LCKKIAEEQSSDDEKPSSNPHYAGFAKIPAVGEEKEMQAFHYQTREDLITQIEQYEKNNRQNLNIKKSNIMIDNPENTLRGIQKFSLFDLPLPAMSYDAPLMKHESCDLCGKRNVELYLRPEKVFGKHGEFTKDFYYCGLCNCDSS
jgi:hypothetical protein